MGMGEGGEIVGLLLGHRWDGTWLRKGGSQPPNTVAFSPSSSSHTHSRNVRAAAKSSRCTQWPGIIILLVCGAFFQLERARQFEGTLSIGYECAYNSVLEYKKQRKEESE